ncbi:MATE family efflux transporter [Halothermothrix orenii]|uniref:Probable multidrug resistance protein NorM n=1 Tax=Halothermothrix orenii (strain H 168 / OCM 544 / DSM 9562) TaxID=373903 RepID=B8CWL5_HALOH|nr:MATE family efflux transporter [Halothermothrix orenii]ACL69684.1 MATE efflux family protein [Halothermothrix orenii H 168]
MLLINEINRRKEMIKNILVLAFPAVMEMSLNTMLGFADTLMISRIIGKEGLAAVGFANQIIFTLIFIFSSFNAGATAMVARSYGEKNYKRLNKIVGENLTLNLFIGIIIFMASYFYGDQILKVFDISKNVYQMGLSYLKVVSFSQLFMFISFAAAASLRGAGDTKTPMYITGMANILNIFGNYALMTGFYVFPELGIAGAALSTTISRAIAAFLYLYILISGERKIKLHFHSLRISTYIIKPLWKLSYAAALEQFFMQLAFFTNGIIISKLDTTSEAAFRILINIESTSFMPAIGIAIATTTLVGKHLGEKNPEKSLDTGYTAALLGIVWGIFMGTIFFLLPVPILSIFTSESPLISRAINSLKIAGFNQPLLAFMIIMAGALRGAGDTRGAMILTSLRLWTIFIPLSYVFAIILQYGVAGVWIAEISSFIIFSILINRRFKSMKWAKIKIFD